MESINAQKKKKMTGINTIQTSYKPRPGPAHGLAMGCILQMGKSNLLSSPILIDRVSFVRGSMDLGAHGLMNSDESSTFIFLTVIVTVWVQVFKLLFVAV